MLEGLKPPTANKPCIVARKIYSWDESSESWTEVVV